MLPRPSLPPPAPGRRHKGSKAPRIEPRGRRRRRRAPGEPAPAASPPLPPREMSGYSRKAIYRARSQECAPGIPLRPSFLHLQGKGGKRNSGLERPRAPSQAPAVRRAGGLAEPPPRPCGISHLLPPPPSAHRRRRGLSPDDRRGGGRRRRKGEFIPAEQWGRRRLPGDTPSPSLSTAGAAAGPRRALPPPPPRTRAAAARTERWSPGTGKGEAARLGSPPLPPPSPPPCRRRRGGPRLAPCSSPLSPPPLSGSE